MSFTNAYGDVEITDPTVMRALAHPVRLAALTHLQRHGPATATTLAVEVGVTPSAMSWHLRHLAGFGLVRESEGEGQDRRRRWWEAVARGFRIVPPADGADAAFRELSDQLLATAVDQVRDWARDDLDRLDPAWSARAGSANTGLLVTPEELDALEQGIEQLLAPYLASRRDRVEGAVPVRVVRFVLPQAGPLTEARS